nr:extensin-like [Lolium perenne]
MADRQYQAVHVFTLKQYTMRVHGKQKTSAVSDHQADDQHHRRAFADEFSAALKQYCGPTLGATRQLVLAEDGHRTSPTGEQRGGEPRRAGGECGGDGPAAHGGGRAGLTAHNSRRAPRGEGQKRPKAEAILEPPPQTKPGKRTSHPARNPPPRPRASHLPRASPPTTCRALRLPPPTTAARSGCRLPPPPRARLPPPTPPAARPATAAPTTLLRPPATAAPHHLLRPPATAAPTTRCGSPATAAPTTSLRLPGDRRPHHLLRLPGDRRPHHLPAPPGDRRPHHCRAAPVTAAPATAAPTTCSAQASAAPSPAAPNHLPRAQPPPSPPTIGGATVAPGSLPSAPCAQLLRQRPNQTESTKNL